MKTIQLSDMEISVLLELIDYAVRAQGLVVAQNAFVLAAKLRAVQQAEMPIKEETGT